MVNGTSTPTIENVVGSTSLETEIDVGVLAEDIETGAHTQDDFCGLVYSPDGFDASLLAFRTGKIIVAGAKSSDEVEDVCGMFFSELESLGLNTPPTSSVVVENIVCTADLKTNFNLNTLAIGFGLEEVEYEPEQFNGLVYHQDTTDIGVTFLIFHNGSIVITGAKTYNQTEKALTHLLDEIDSLGVGVEDNLHSTRRE